MKFLQLSSYFCASILILMQASLMAFEPKVELAGRKDLVLGIESRQTVLALAAQYLASPDDDFLLRIEDLTDPFVFKSASPVVVVEKDTGDNEAGSGEVFVHYEDADVLALSVASFGQKVRGTIIRGDSSYLQLEGGVLLKPGSSFPVRLPRAKEQVFTLTITEITPVGYTLQIGEASQQLRFDGNSPSNSGRIQFTNP